MLGDVPVPSIHGFPIFFKPTVPASFRHGLGEAMLTGLRQIDPHFARIAQQRFRQGHVGGAACRRGSRNSKRNGTGHGDTFVLNVQYAHMTCA